MTLRVVVTTLAMAVMVACGSSSYSPSSPSPLPSGAGPATVSIVNGASALTTNAYAPNPIDIAAGTTVTWINNDSTAHDSTSNNGTWASGTIAPGGQFSRTFPTAGTFPYRCTLHPGMVGTVNVK